MESSTSMLISEKQEKRQYFYRKLQSVGQHVSLSVTLPKTYINELELKRDDFVRVSKDNGKIIVEKVV